MSLKVKHVLWTVFHKVYEVSLNTISHKIDYYYINGSLGTFSTGDRELAYTGDIVLKYWMCNVNKMLAGKRHVDVSPGHSPVFTILITQDAC